MISYKGIDSLSFDLKVVLLDENDFEYASYLETDPNINKSKTRRFSNMISSDIARQFKDMQEQVMSKEIPILSRLLDETPFDTGYESLAERYFEQLSENYGPIADTILQNIYLQNMYHNQYLLKHLLFIVSNLPASKRKNLEIIPLAGISNPDIEIQDLSVKCFEAWEDKRHVPTLINLRNHTRVQWFKDYISDVIDELEEE